MALPTPRIDQMLTKFRQRTCSETAAPVAQSQSSPAVHSAAAETVETLSDKRIQKLEEQVNQLMKKVLI